MTEGKLRKLLSELGVEVTHKNRKGWLLSKCPFAEFTHEFGTDRNPSFNIKTNDEGYSGFKCFTCKQKGNLSTLINKLGDFRGRDYSKLAIRAMLEETPVDFKDFDESREEAAWSDEISSIDSSIYLKMYPSVWDDKRSRSYLEGRGISQRTVDLLDLRFDSEQLRVLFPVYGYDRALYGFTGRTILDKEDYPSPKYPKVKDYAGLKKDSLILGEHLIDPSKPILLVEGLFALAHTIEIGCREFCNPVASMGSFLSDLQRDIIVDYDQSVFVLYDDDLAGHEGMFGAIEDGYHNGEGALEHLRPHVPTFQCLYPEDIHDPDKLNKSHVKSMVVGNLNEQV